MEIGKKGLIFSLDAVFAVLLTTILVAGIMRLEFPTLGYEQYGYERLSRNALDALLCLEKSGTLGESIRLLMEGHRENSIKLLRQTLRSLLSDELQFRLEIAEENFTIHRTRWRRVGRRWMAYTEPLNCHLIVYPDDSQAWNDIFLSQEETAVAYRVTTDFLIVENIRVLAWVDDEKENAFVREVCRGWPPPWTTNSENEFRNLLTAGPDVVLLPDVSRSLSYSTVQALYNGNRLGLFGVVGGGETIRRQDPFTRTLLQWTFGVRYRRVETGRENVRITDNTHYITSDFFLGENVPYESTLEQFRYRVSRGRGLNTRVLAQSYWPGGGRQENAAIIVRAESVGQAGRAVLFNTRMPQSAMYDNLDIKHMEWVILTRKAIEWASKKTPRLQPVTLYLWRGEHD